MKRVITAVLVVALALSCSSITSKETSAAVKPKLSKKTLTMKTGEKKTLMLKKAKGKVTERYCR